MIVDALLDRLVKPRKTGAGSWMARCPAHADKTPSLTIREADDGRVLLKCHAECSTESVLTAVGLTFSDLYPPKALGDHAPKLRRPFPAADVLEAIMQDALVVQQVAIEVERTAVVTPKQRAAMRLAVARIASARDLVNG